MSRFKPAAAYRPSADWELLPFRFERMNDRVLLTNLVGEHLFVGNEEFAAFMERQLPSDSAVIKALRAKHIIRQTDEQAPVQLLSIKARSRYRRLAQSTSLHLFVVSLRCEHSCPYCQVSRQNQSQGDFDMSPEIAMRGLELAFRSPSRLLKIEFQGGEPFLNFELVEQIVHRAEAMNAEAQKVLTFVIATNLALLDDRILEFCRAHDIFISTSLDGPADLHNRNRPRPGRDSWELTVAGIKRVRESLGAHRVSALMTTTKQSFGRAREIIDCYLEHGLNSVFLRPLSPYGFAIKTKSFDAYDIQQWLDFYFDGLDYIIDLNRKGVDVREVYASIILKKILTNRDPGYVDLTSPSGIGIGALVYNYDGDVYASDEGRMLAEMRDTTFRLGNLRSDSYEDIMLSEALLGPLEESFAASAPMCSDCAFEPYCGADPVYHHATTGDFVGRKPDSGFCQRNMAIFKAILDRYESDPHARRLFLTWAGQ